MSRHTGAYERLCLAASLLDYDVELWMRQLEDGPVFTLAVTDGDVDISTIRTRLADLDVAAELCLGDFPAPKSGEEAQ